MDTFTVTQHVQQCVSDFSALTQFPDDFGFSAYTESDLEAFLSNSAQFSIRFKRQSGASILYGVDHANARRYIFNGLPQDQRIQLFRDKVSHLVALEDVVGDTTLEDVMDIGMGHSVYHVIVQNSVGEQSGLVVKQKGEKDAQAFYCELLRLLEKLSFSTRFLEYDGGLLEISDYLGAEKVESWVCEDLNRVLVLGQHAAIGDVMGVGDRHLENYVPVGEDLAAVDVTFLVWPDNEEWTARYIAGGLYEMCVLGHWIDDPLLFLELWQKYWHAYRDTLLMLQSKQSDIESLIESFFDEKESEKAKVFVAERLSHVGAYYMQQYHMASVNFLDMLRRRIYKELLVQLRHECEEAVVKVPLLEMYYWADKDRNSTFLHLEEGRSNLLRDIESLATQHLGVSAEDIAENETRISAIYDQLIRSPKG